MATRSVSAEKMVILGHRDHQVWPVQQDKLQQVQQVCQVHKVLLSLEQVHKVLQVRKVLRE